MCKNEIIDYDEEFKDITYPGIKPKKYKISNYGRVWNIITKKIMKPFTDKDGYKRINLVTKYKNDNPKRRGNKTRNYFIHRLVAWEFLGSPPDETKTIINHKNGIPNYNYVHNLEWVSVLENTLHAKKLGLLNNKGINASSCKYSKKKIRKICKLFEKGYNNIEIFELLTGHKKYKEENTGLYQLINKLGKRTSYRDIVINYNYLPPISYFYCNEEIGKIRKMILLKYTNMEILNAFGIYNISDDKKFYEKIISERTKCEVLFNDYRKNTLEEISKLIIE